MCYNTTVKFYTYYAFKVKYHSQQGKEDAYVKFPLDTKITKRQLVQIMHKQLYLNSEKEVNYIEEIGSDISYQCLIEQPCTFFLGFSF